MKKTKQNCSNLRAREERKILVFFLFLWQHLKKYFQKKIKRKKKKNSLSLPIVMEPTPGISQTNNPTQNTRTRNKSNMSFFHPAFFFFFGKGQKSIKKQKIAKIPQAHTETREKIFFSNHSHHSFLVLVQK
jgi:hypothetical protein